MTMTRYGLLIRARQSPGGCRVETRLGPQYAAEGQWIVDTSLTGPIIVDDLLAAEVVDIDAYEAPIAAERDALRTEVAELQQQIAALKAAKPEEIKPVEEPAVGAKLQAAAEETVDDDEEDADESDDDTDNNDDEEDEE